MYTPIKLDKMRNLRYGMRAIKTIEELTGKPISKIDFENMTINDFSIVVYSGLAHEDKELTPDKVIDLIDEHSDIQTVAKTMSKAITQAFGRKNAQGAALEQMNGTGTLP